VRNAWIVVLLLAGSARAAWWNAEWTYRAKVTVARGVSRYKGKFVEHEMNFADLLKRAGATGDFDANSPRVTWLNKGAEQEAPSRFFPDEKEPAKGVLLWSRPGKPLRPGQTQTFFIYFDVKAAARPAKAYPELANRKPTLGKSLVENASFETPDEKDPTRPAKWSWKVSPKLGKVEWVTGVAHSGERSLKVTCLGNPKVMTTASQWVPVTEGKRYAVTAWVKFAPGNDKGFAAASAWYYTKQGRPVSAPEGGVYGNHKSQSSARVQPKESPWIFLGYAGQNVYDPKLKKNLWGKLPLLVPGTAKARVEVSGGYGTVIAYFDDVTYSELSAGQPVGVHVEAVEKRP